MKFIKYLVVFFIVIFGSYAQETKQLTDNEKIHYLLNRVKNTKHIFIRNGESHTGAKAYEHLNFKLNYAKKAFIFFGPEKNISTKDFIEKIASKSSSTGKDYKIKLTTGKTIKVRKWLYGLLDELKNVSHSKLTSKKNK